MRHVSRILASAVVTASFCLSSPAAHAETPPDTLIQAWQIDDIISLDPAAVFEFTASEILRNSYQPLIEVDSQTYEVRADGLLLVCEPAVELPLAQRYFLF